MPELRTAKVLIIARKDAREALTSRGTYAYLPALLLMTSYFFVSYFGLADSLTKQGATQETLVAASRAFLTNLAYFIPILYAVGATNMSSSNLLFEKSKRSLESLLAAPVSLRTVWMGKSLGAAITGLIFGLGLSLFAYLVISLGEVLPKTHQAIAPDGLVFLNALVLVPMIVFLVSMLLAYVQLVVTNPRVSNIAGIGAVLLVWGVLFFASTYLPLKGISVSYFPLVFLGLIVLLAALCYLFSLRLRKEQVVLSSKG